MARAVGQCAFGVLAKEVTMYAADSFEHIMMYVGSGLPKKGSCWMCGFLFAPPGTSIGKSIFDRLMDWHFRSGDNFDFFCVGYGNWKQEQAEPVARLTRDPRLSPIDYYYNPRSFQEIRKQVEALSGWRYSGEADLLLVNAIRDSDTGKDRLEFDEIVALDIDRLIRENVFSTTARLLERVCQAADDAVVSGDQLSVIDFSDKEAARSFLRGALSTIVNTLKVDTLLGARHFLVGGHFLRV